MKRNAPSGAMGTKAANCWRNMQRRCYDESDSGYAEYGGRGIIVCERWLASFNFFLKDMGLPPSADHSIDRIDNDGDYEPDNCRWATRAQQMRNTRRASKMIFEGVEVDPNEWADAMGFRRNFVYIQVHYHGRSGEEIVSTRWKNRHLILARLAKNNSPAPETLSVADSVESA